MKIFYKTQEKIRGKMAFDKEVIHMKKETRTVVYDDELRIEAYRFEGIVQPFPSHFHEHYVIGFVEKGERVLSCRDREYAIEEGSIVLFNPGDSHACVQSDGGTFDYRGVNISKEIMLDLAEEVTGKRELPGFSENVVYDEEAACHLRPLHEMVMKGQGSLRRRKPCCSCFRILSRITGSPPSAASRSAGRRLKEPVNIWVSISRSASI